MLKKTILFICLLVTMCASVCQASASILEHPTVAIMPFQNKGIISKEWNREDMNMVTGYVYEALIDSKFQFNLVEREEMRKITDEYALQNTGLIDSNASIQIGKLKGAQYLLIGSIMGVTARKATTSVAGAGSNRYQVTAMVSMRLVNTETGDVVLASVGRGVAKNTVVKGPLNIIRIGTAELDDTQVQGALEQSVYNAVSKMETKVYGGTPRK